MAKRNKKRISKEALKKIDDIVKNKIAEIIKKSSRNAELYGRSTIKKEDIE